VIILTSLFLTGCLGEYLPESIADLYETPPFTWSYELFESTITEDGYTRTIFRTNDVKYWTLEGSTIWTVWGEAEAVFTSRTVRMSKSSGFSTGGYGIVFCHGEHEIEGYKKHAMLVVMINNNRQYIIGKAVGGVFTDFGWWRTTPHLDSGGAPNLVTVTYDEEAEKFRLIINGHEVDQFSDNDFPVLRSGRNGYIAVITPFDNFPFTGINISFLEDKR